MEMPRRIALEAGEPVEQASQSQVSYYLSPSVIADARAVFDRYCDLEKRQHQNRNRLLTRARSMRLFPTPLRSRHQAGKEESQGRIGEEPSQQSGAKPAASLSVPLEENLTAEEIALDSANEPMLGVEGLQQFFRDLDVPLSALEVAELVHALENDPIGYDTATAAPEMATSAQTNTSTKKSPQRGHGTKDLSREAEVAPAPVSARKEPTRDKVNFNHFVFILSHVVPEKECVAAVKDAEIGDLFRLVDRDGDGVISVADVRAMAQSLAEDGGLGDDRDIQRLLQMSAVEIKAAVMECDVDGDGLLSVEDLRSSLRS